MRRILFTSLLCALLAIPAFARVKPLKLGEKPHSFWRHDIQPVWNGRSLDEFENSRINSDNSGQLQNEQQVCINPTNPDNRVAVWRDFRLGYRRVGVGYTMDKGVTWTDALFPQMYYEQASDPVLVVDDQGVFTAMMISYNPGYVENGMLQVSSYDGGVTWQDSAWAVHTTDFTSFEDKEMLAVDTSALSPYYGTFYCVWSRFYSATPGVFDSTKIVCTRKPQGEPYSEPVIVSPEQTSVQWSNVAIGINGEVFLSWVGWVPDSTGEWWLPTISFAKSLDGGATFSVPITVRQTEFIHAEINPALVTYAFAPMAIDHSGGPDRGRLYMLFTDSQNLEDTDVYLIYSDDQGDNWSEPRIMHDDNEMYSVDQFHPWISVDEEGRVWVAFYDRRNDPNNLLMDLYFTVSDDGGETWRPNERITDVSCNPGAGSLDAGLIGEYIGWCAQGGEAIAVWTDTRMGNQDCFTAVIDSIFADTSHAMPEHDLVLQPASLSLSAYPNPTNSEVSLLYLLPSASDVELHLYNTLGQEVKKLKLGFQPLGEHAYSLELSGLATGLYVAEMRAAGQSAYSKLMLLK